VTATDKQGRVSQTVSDEFYGMGKPSTLQDNRVGVYSDRIVSWPISNADIADQKGPAGSLTIVQQVKNPSRFNEWWSSPEISVIGERIQTDFGEVFGSGQKFDCRYVVTNEFGLTVTSWTASL
jgi:hypothetical protein